MFAASLIRKTNRFNITGICCSGKAKLQVKVTTDGLLLQCWILLQITPNGFPHHRVLAHQYHYKMNTFTM